MILTKNYKKYDVNGTKYWREQYMRKGMSVYLWRYGYVVTIGNTECAMMIKDGLLSRPNLKKLFS